MKYLKYTFKEAINDYEVTELTEEQAFKVLDGIYRDTSIFRGKQFRLNTMSGYIETRSKNGLCPAPGFYGVCE